VLLAVDGVARWRSHDARTDENLSELLARIGCIHAEVAVDRALEHEVAGGSEQAAVVNERIVDTPHFALSDRVPRLERATPRQLGGFMRMGSIAQPDVVHESRNVAGVIGIDR